MAYSKHTWGSGEVISTQNLNNIEDGIESHDTLFNGVGAEAIYLLAGSDKYKVTVDVSGGSPALKLEKVS